MITPTEATDLLNSLLASLGETPDQIASSLESLNLKVPFYRGSQLLTTFLTPSFPDLVVMISISGTAIYDPISTTQLCRIAHPEPLKTFGLKFSRGEYPALLKK